MIEPLSTAILDDFKRIAKYDVALFFNDFLEFSDIHYANIINYFSGITNVIPKQSISLLDRLIKEQKKLIDIFNVNTQSLSDYKYWIICEYVEDIGTTLETAANTARWLRASSTLNGYKNQTVVELMLAQGQTLEDFERVKIGSDQFKETWIETAMQNQLAEEDYDSSGGVLIKASFKNNSSIVLEGVVDLIDEAQKTYGIDIDREIEIVADDLKVLSYKDTIIQCADILCGLKQGDDHSFPDRGLSKNFIGSNIAGLTYPSIFRQLAGNISTDDSFKSISILDIKREQDAVMIEIQLATKAGDTFNNAIQL